MMQLKTEKVYVEGIPVHVVYPIQEEGKAVILYHGWSSQAQFQLTKAAILAIHGYTVFIPDAMHHGERDALTDYYQVEDYDIFWKTIFQNIEEYPKILSFVKTKGYKKPYIMGHSMGGMTVLGIGSTYPTTMKGIISFNGSGDWLLTHLFMQARFGIAASPEWNLYPVLKEKNPLAHVDEMKNIPIFMTNGESDISVDPRAQAHFYDVLKQSGGQATRITYPLLGHFVTTNMMDDAMRWMESVSRVNA
ncbi:MAG TPA: alpha/beta hydrolase [Dialister sp.]|nr:alpha/beta hydrolase [Dialister sp.]